MTMGKTVWRLWGVVLAAYLIGPGRAYSTEISEPFYDTDYRACLMEGAAGQEEFQAECCQCVVGKLHSGMNLEEYIRFTSGLNTEDMTDEELVLKGMINDRVNAWIQVCVVSASPLS